MHILIYTDGAARGNPGPSASGYLVMDENQNMIAKRAVYNGIKTNNFAEYNSIVLALEWCKGYYGNPKVVDIDIYSDSEVAVRQIKGTYKTKAVHLSELNKKVKSLCANFKSVAFHNLPREHEGISEVDKRLNQLLDKI